MKIDDVVIIGAGRYDNEPGVIVAIRPRTIDVVLGRTGQYVTIRHSSIAEIYPQEQ